MRLIILFLGLSTIAACAGVEIEPPANPGEVFDDREVRDRERFGVIGGDEGLILFESGTATTEEGGGGVLGVNAFLWRASLETLDFIPLASADPFGGLIISDWYQAVEAPGERVKLHILIKDQILRADTLKVSIFRQVNSATGWLDAPVDLETARDLEDRILTKARELRIAQNAGTS